MGMKKCASVYFWFMVALSGCSHGVNDITFIEDALVSYKRALVSAQERMILEEFAKYEHLGQSFVALFKIEEVTLEPQTKLTRASKTSMTAEVGSILTAPAVKIAGGREASISNDQGGKISLKLKAFSSDKAQKAQEYFAKRIAESNGSTKVYELSWYDEKHGKSYQACFSDSQGLCQMKEIDGLPCGDPYTYLHCVPITGHMRKYSLGEGKTVSLQGYAMVPLEYIPRFRDMMKGLEKEMGEGSVFFNQA